MKRNEIKRDTKQIYQVSKGNEFISLGCFEIKAWCKMTDGYSYPIFDYEFDEYALVDVLKDDDEYFYSAKEAIKYALEKKKEKYYDCIDIGWLEYEQIFGKEDNKCNSEI